MRQFIHAIKNILRPIPIFNPFKLFKNYFHYFVTLLQYKHQSDSPITISRLRPVINEWINEQKVDALYFLQDTWAARKIFEVRPNFHVDIGSTCLLVGILSQFTRLCSVEIRPISVHLNGLERITGSITNLPFLNNSIGSLSSLCVIEHIGLGRYGDPIDPLGPEKAAGEIVRVLSIGGNLYISTQIEGDFIYFNAYRTFSLESFLNLFHKLQLRELLYIQGSSLYLREDFHQLDLLQSQVYGLFHFVKP